jgi:hypothetical protein
MFEYMTLFNISKFMNNIGLQNHGLKFGWLAKEWTGEVSRQAGYRTDSLSQQNRLSNVRKIICTDW